MMTVKSKLLVALAVVDALVMVSSPAMAATWSQKHPRQHEVLAREHNQIRRINQERREGELTRGQARALRAGDRAIASQDHADARANGGYITRKQQAQLNREENAQSAAIGH
jgi:hypothetical protein